MNESIACNCRNLKRNGLIHGCFSRDGIIRIKREERARPVKIFHMSKLHQLFLDFDFGDVDEDDYIFLDLRTCFDSTILEGDKSFHLKSYNLLKANNAKRGGVSIYYKESLGAREVNLSNLSQRVIWEVSLQNCKGCIGVVYRSPSQYSTEFESFLFDFDELLSKIASTNSLFAIILGDFNARSLSWWKEEKTTTEGTHLEAFTSLPQLSSTSIRTRTSTTSF